ncbi:AsmA-like C-terminal region-containing protein [Pseudooceanicola sp.]|uniref:AsmA-like C-terminal region-containing protein n=1 Tax=Pseudooceanicola sp. TaxID=1914328 RepID=UPI0035171DE1
MTKTEEPGSDRQTAEQAAPPRRRAHRHVLRALVLTVGALLAFTLVTLGLTVMMMAHERPLYAPAWLKQKIEARLDETLHGLAVDFDDIGLVVDEAWRPRVQLSGLEVQRAGSDARLALSTIEGTLAVGPLLRGQVRPDTLYLSGAQMRLYRDAEGGFDLALGEGGAARSAGTLPRRVSGNDLGTLSDEIEALLDLPDLRELTRIEATALTLRYEDARSDRAWTVDGGRAVLERRGNDLQLRGDFALLGGRAWASTLSVSYASRIGDKAASFAMSFEDMAAEDLSTQSAALAWLEVIDAPASGALRATVDSGGRLGPLNATLQIGEGVLRPDGGSTPIPFRSAQSYFTYDPVAQALTLSEFRVDSDYLSARAEGALHLYGTARGRPREMVGQLRMTEFSAQPGDMIPDPVAFSDVRADLRLRLDPFALTIGQISLSNGSEELSLNGEVTAGPKGWDVSAEGAMTRLSTAELLQLWPRTVAVKTREWMEKYVAQGALENIQLGLRLTEGTRPDLYLGFEFSEAEMVLVKGLPPAKEMRGHASLFRNRFVAAAEGGHVTAPQGGRVDLAGTVFIVPDTTIKPAPAEVELRTDGTITATLSLLDQEPFRFLAKAGRPVTLADGRVRLDGRMAFPLKKGRTPDEYDVVVDGTITDLRSDVLVPGRRLSAQQVEMRLADNLLSFEGGAQIGAVPVGGRFETQLGPKGDGSARIDGWVELSERFIDEFRIGVPPGSLQGQGRARIALDLQKGQPPDFRLSTDFAGVGLRIAALDWSLPRAARGQLTVEGAFGKPARIDRLAIDAPGLTAAGSLTLSESGGMAAARFDRVQVGGWFDGPVTLTGRGKGRSPAVAVTGGTVDMRRAKLGGGGGQGGPVTLALDRLQISDTIALEGFRGRFDTGGGMNGTFTANVNGRAAISGTVVPRNGRSALRVTSADAGGVLAATGLLKQAREGALDLTLLPVGPAGIYDGTLRVSGLRIHEAPAMAALLNAISVVGLVEQLAGRGIVFNDVDAKFRLTPQQVIVTQSSAVGASLGISMDGVYDVRRKLMDMQGVVSPVYMLNGIGSLLTRKGEGLFGFNYTLRGPSAAPQVSVNPLSLLTPGMFREIFRRPPPRISQAPTQ